MDRTSWTEPPGCYGLWGLVREAEEGRASAESDKAMGIAFNPLPRRALRHGRGDKACVVGVLCMSGSDRPQGITDCKGRPNRDKSKGVRTARRPLVRRANARREFRGGRVTCSAHELPEDPLESVDVLEDLSDGAFGNVSPGDRDSQGGPDFFCASGRDSEEVESISSPSARTLPEI